MSSTSNPIDTYRVTLNDGMSTRVKVAGCKHDSFDGELTIYGTPGEVAVFAAGQWAYAHGTASTGNGKSGDVYGGN